MLHNIILYNSDIYYNNIYRTRLLYKIVQDIVYIVQEDCISCTRLYIV